MMGFYGDYWNWNGACGWSGYGWVMMIFFWVVIIAAFFVFIKWMKDQNIISGRGNLKTALNILEERYAKGEIGREEFLKAKKDLE